MLKKNREGLFYRHADRSNLMEQMRKGTLFQHKTPETTLPLPIQHPEQQCFLNDITLDVWGHQPSPVLPILKPISYHNKQPALYSSLYMQGREKRVGQWCSKQEGAQDGKDSTKENTKDISMDHRKICFEEKLERTALSTQMNILNRSLKRSLHVAPSLLCLKGRDYHEQLKQLKQIVGKAKQLPKRRTNRLHNQLRHQLHNQQSEDDKEGASIPAFLLRTLQMQWPI